MLPTVRARLCALAAAAAVLAVPAAAQAVTASADASAAPGQLVSPSGGSVFATAPAVDTAECAGGIEWRCASGQELTVSGSELQDVTSVAFVGRRGRLDDRIARPREVDADSLVVVVPRGARSGRLRVRDADAVGRSERKVRIVGRRLAGAVEATSGEDDGNGMVFPIVGEHDMGQTETNSFGGGRGHQGHDLFAECGTPLVAVTAAVVQQKAYHSAAGHYVVLKDDSGQSFAYMHLRSASHLAIGDEVDAGDRVGRVGDTGRATGCHLHFERWTAPGWYTGGRAVDPLSLLKRLEAQPHRHD